MADYDFENITPWDGEKDTGYHVRMKWKRNFERIKAFIAEIRGELAEIGHNLSTMFLRKDQDDRTEHSLGVGGDLIIDGAAHIGQAMLVYDEVNHAIRVTAADGSGLTIGLWADGFISAMGLNSSGASGGSGGGASALYQLVDVVANATGDGVSGAAVGKVLMYNGTKWEAATVVIPTKLSQFIDDIGLLNEADRQTILDSLSSHTGDKSNPHAVSFSQLTSHPTTVEGYGITNALTDDDGIALSEAIGDASQQARNAMSVAMRAEFLAEHAIDDLFELVNIGTDEQPSYAIRAKFGFYSDSFISAMGLNSSGASGGSGGGASALYQLVDVVANATGDGVNGAAVGKVLMYNGTKWEAATVVIPTKLSQFIDDIGLLNEADRQTILDSLSSHTGNKSNPHAVTKAQIGLGSVDNLAASDYFTALSSTSDTNLSATIGGTTRTIAALYATYLGGQPSSYYATAAALTSHTGNKSNPHAVSFIQLTSHPTTVEGYGITNALTDDDGIALSEAIGDASQQARNAMSVAMRAEFLAEHAIDDLFELVNIGTDEQPSYAIRAKFGFYSDSFISAMGLNTSGASGSGGGASALYQLVDVVVNATGDGVNGAAVGKVLMYNGTKWEAATVVIPTKLSQFIDDIGLLYDSDGQALAVAIHEAMQRAATAQGAADKAQFTAEMAQDAADKAAADAASALSEHTGNKSNPHAVTKAQVGLGSVDNLAASAYFTALSSTSDTNLSATIGGTTRTIAALYATYLGGQPSSYYATAAALTSHTGNKSNPHAVNFSQLTSHPTTVEGYGITNALTDDDGIALSEAIEDASQQAREAMSVSSKLQQEVDRQLDNDDAQAVISYLMQQIRQLSDQVSRLNTEVNQLRSYWQLDANGDLYTKHNLYSQKAITAMKTV